MATIEFRERSKMSGVSVQMSSPARRSPVAFLRRAAGRKSLPVAAAVGIALVASAALWFAIVQLIRAFA